MPVLSYILLYVHAACVEKKERCIQWVQVEMFIMLKGPSACPRPLVDRVMDGFYTEPYLMSATMVFYAHALPTSIRTTLRHQSRSLTMERSWRAPLGRIRWPAAVLSAGCAPAQDPGGGDDEGSSRFCQMWVTGSHCCSRSAL